MRSIAVVALIVIAVSGCSTSNQAAAPACLACENCRVEATSAMKIVRRSGSGKAQVRRIKTFRCVGCQGDVEIYEEDGAACIKCSHCAKNGVRCTED